MSSIHLLIENIKNIKHAELDVPLEKGMYAFVGENGCGKSTLMLALSLTVKTSSAKMLKPYDISTSSRIFIALDDVEDNWTYKKGVLSTGKYSSRRSINGSRSYLCVSTHLEGFYEGSIFYGSRFDDYNVVEEFMNRTDFPDLTGQRSCIWK